MKLMDNNGRFSTSQVNCNVAGDLGKTDAMDENSEERIGGTGVGAKQSTVELMTFIADRDPLRSNDLQSTKKEQ